MSSLSALKLRLYGAIQICLLLFIFAMQYKKVQKSSWNEPHSSFTSPSHYYHYYLLKQAQDVGLHKDDLAGLPSGWNFYPHTHPIPIPIGIPIPTADLQS